MTKAQVAKLVAILMACYPNAQVPPGTLVAYESFLVDLDHDQAQRAVANLVRSSKFFPTIAEVVMAYEALSPRSEVDHHQRYLGPRYTGRPMRPRELHAEVTAFLARPFWQPVLDQRRRNHGPCPACGGFPFCSLGCQHQASLAEEAARTEPSDAAPRAS